jgi:dTDP-4-amino-4,6-dideoxygalactose transaminase
VHVRKKLDIAWGNLAYGAVRSVFSGDAAALERRLEDFWSAGGDALACLSVRSGFDLLLQALALPAGSEILVSAVTIRDMVRIIERHGLVAVPVDLDMDSLSVRADDIARRSGPRSKALLVAHLFGSRMPMEELIRAARERGLVVIEDCAQAYDGTGYRGHPESDVSLFSFGPIKTATALGGALLRVRDAALLARMRRLQGEYPRQSRLDYLGRVAKYSGLKLLSARLPYTLFVAACRLLGRNHDSVIGGSARSFTGHDLFAAIRRRPAGALLALLERRLQRFDPRTVGDRAALAGAQLWRGGFDATRGTTSLYVVPPAPREAGRVMAQVVYVPLNPRMGAKAIGAIGKILSNDRARGDSRCYEKTFPT